MERMVQIIDLSQKILFDKMQAEILFHSMITAAVSHELRNPLNSMIGQVFVLNGCLKHLASLIKMVAKVKEVPQELKK
jgi:signal transduction histidine kinase